MVIRASAQLCCHLVVDHALNLHKCQIGISPCILVYKVTSSGVRKFSPILGEFSGKIKLPSTYKLLRRKFVGNSGTRLL